MKFKRHSNVDGIKKESVIVVESILGNGTETDPVRKIREYFLIDGTLLARIDGKYKPFLKIGEWTEDKDTVYESYTTYETGISQKRQARQSAS